LFRFSLLSSLFRKNDFAKYIFQHLAHTKNGKQPLTMAKNGQQLLAITSDGFQ
jgi:hypothetical protein